MRTYEYIGDFISDEGHHHTIKVNCNGFIQAFILLTAEAIKQGKHYQLDCITDEEGGMRQIDNINLIGELIN